MHNIYRKQNSHAKPKCFVENAQQACEEVLLHSKTTTTGWAKK